jgi:hypothetical protein
MGKDFKIKKILRFLEGFLSALVLIGLAITAVFCWGFAVIFIYGAILIYILSKIIFTLKNKKKKKNL